MPYHGALHGADVLQSAHALLIQNEAFDGSLNEDTILVVLVAALAHDVGHPGLTNAFLVETQHELAVRYNDHSPLENMHSRVALDLARPWLATLDADARKRARSTWIAVCESTGELGRRGQTSEISSSVTSKSIRLISGRIDCSRRVLEAQRTFLGQNIRLRAH